MPKKKFSGRATGRTGTRVAGKARGGQRNMDWIKPPQFKDYLTKSEVSIKLSVDPRWLERLEAAGRIPKAARVAHGKLEYRLWSPKQVEEIRQIMEGHRVGRPKSS
jgi:hypothetical protein